MTGNVETIKNCPVIIYDNEGNYLAKAIIMEYDRVSRNISVTDSLPDVRRGARSKTAA